MIHVPATSLSKCSESCKQWKETHLLAFTMHGLGSYLNCEICISLPWCSVCLLSLWWMLCNELCAHADEQLNFWQLGQRTANILKHLFPVPKPDTKRIVTFGNQSDYISFRLVSFYIFVLNFSSPSTDTGIIARNKLVLLPSQHSWFFTVFKKFI